MQLINAGPREIVFRIFRDDDKAADPSNWIVYWTRSDMHKERLAVGKRASYDAGRSDVQLEVTEYAQLGVAAGAPPRPNVLVNANPSHLYSNSKAVVFNGRDLVELSGNLLDVCEGGKSDPARKTDEPTPVSINVSSLLSVVVAIFDGLVAGYAQPSLVLGGGKLAGGVAGAILGMFRADAPHPSLELSQISDSLKSLLNEMKANEARSHILAASDWFSGYVAKSANLKRTGTGQDLDEFDRSQFLNELDEYLDGQNAFKPAMDELTYNREWRYNVIAEYILGVGIMLNIERIQLMLKQEKTPLKVSDIEEMEGRIARYRGALAESEEDFTSKRLAFFTTYPILSANEVALWDEPGKTVAAVIPEMEKAARGYIVKYLKGDRQIISKAMSRLDDVKKEVRAYDLH